MSENEQTKKDTFSRDSGNAAVLKKMQYQLDAIERKLDSLLRQSGQGNFKSSYPAKPRREFDNSSRPFGQKYPRRNEGARSPGKFYNGLQSGARKGPSKSSFGRRKSPSPRKRA